MPPPEMGISPCAVATGPQKEITRITAREFLYISLHDQRPPRPPYNKAVLRSLIFLGEGSNDVGEGCPPTVHHHVNAHFTFELKLIRHYNSETPQQLLKRMNGIKKRIKTASEVAVVTTTVIGIVPCGTPQSGIHSLHAGRQRRWLHSWQSNPNPRKPACTNTHTCIYIYIYIHIHTPNSFKLHHEMQLSFGCCIPRLLR